MYFQNYGLRNTCLDNCPERPTSDDVSTSNIVNGPKYWCNINNRLFTKFIARYESN